MFDTLRRWVKNQPVSTANPYLIIGLGNPGREYRETRHNIGFMVVDELAKHLGTNLSRVQSKALIGQSDVSSQRVYLVKPQTYMNLSGQAVASLVKFYKPPLENILVIHDDLDLPFGTLRMRKNGGSAGQKGLTSIIQHLGTQEFPRLRIGIGRPNGRMDPTDYVLQKLSKGDQDLLNQVLVEAREAVQAFIDQGIESAMNQYNKTLNRE